MFLIFNRWLCRFVFDILISAGKGGELRKMRKDLSLPKKGNTYKKEIGIRKVLGASVFSILRMLNHELMLLVCIANTIALPIAYILVRRWLEAFEYRIDLTLWPFVLSGSIVLLTVGITVSIQSMKSAKANPADSLRYE